MKGVAKAILMTILVSVAIVVLTNLAFFVPFYITLITETFHVSQMVATDNYLRQYDHDTVINRLQNRPIFSENSGAIRIEVLNSDGLSAVGRDDASTYYGDSELSKPYRQRGEPLTITISVVYPFTYDVWSYHIRKTMPVTYTMSTSGLKLYKDLDYNY